MTVGRLRCQGLVLRTAEALRADFLGVDIELSIIAKHLIFSFILIDLIDLSCERCGRLKALDGLRHEDGSYTRAVKSLRGMVVTQLKTVPPFS